MADKKVSELDAITGANTASDDFFLIVDSSGSVSKKISRDELNNAIELDALTTVDINGGTIDGTTIGGSSAAVGTFTTVNSTTLDSTNIEVTNIKSKDGTAAGSIADSTGVVTLASSVLTTTDINGGTVDNVTIGGSTAGVGTFTTLNATTVDSTNLEITNIKAKDGTSAGSIANSTGVVTLSSSVLTTTDINGGTVDGADITVGSGKTLNVSAGTFTLADNQISGDKIDGGTISSFASTGIDDNASSTAITIDSGNKVGIGIASPAANMQLHVENSTGNVNQLLKAGTNFNSTLSFADQDGTSGEINYIHNGDRMEFDVNGSEKLRIETSGQVTLGGSTTAFNTNPTVEGLQLHYKTDVGAAVIASQKDDGFGNIIFQTSPVGGGPSETSFTVNAFQNISMAADKGIDFANNAHATGMSSELFDDYEEGSFVGTLGGATSDPSTAVTATGTYTKIGRLVYAAVGFTNVNTTGASGMIQVTGWPYNSSTTMPSGDVMFYNVSNVRTDTANISAFWASSTLVRFYQSLQGTNIWVAAEHSAGSGRYLYVSVTYETS